MAVRASSSWVVVAGNLVSLAEVVAAEENWDGEADDAEKCVRLEGEGRGEIVLEASPGKVISWVGLTSSRPLWELVGGLQYIASLRGQKLDLGEEDNDDEEEELAVYKGSLPLVPGHSRITLRLPPSSTPPAWLFSLAVTLAPAPPLPPATGHFSLASVDSLLTNSEPLSDKAQQFRAVFQAFQTSGPLSGLPPTLMPPAPPSLSSPAPPTNGGDTSNSLAQDSPTSAASLLLFKSYIDQKFEALEGKLLGAIAASERAQAAKLDKILKLLENQQQAES